MAQRTSRKGRFITIPNQCLVSENFATLTPYATKLFMDLASNCFGYNNGDMNMVWPEMQRRGWKSKETWNNARKELMERGWIIKTRQGWNNRFLGSASASDYVIKYPVPIFKVQD